MRTCPVCHKDFAPCRGNPDQIYCSRSCRNKTLSNRIEKICVRCGKIYEIKASKAEESKYCSRKCKSNRVTYACEMCGKTRTVSAANTAKRFCGNPCRLKWFSVHFSAENSPHWKGGDLSYYGANWRQQRNKARHRDNHTCRICGKHRAEFIEELSVAHIRPFREFGIERYREANALSNLITLCRTCHIKFDYENETRG